MQGHVVAASSLWHAEGTVRTLRSGSRSLLLRAQAARRRAPALRALHAHTLSEWARMIRRARKGMSCVALRLRALTLRA
jgi:hypothetical protein